MSITSKTTGAMRPRLKYHPNAYKFVFEGLRYTQNLLGRDVACEPDDEEAHISGTELVCGIRDLALERYGLLTMAVFRHWGIHETADFGRIVFELVERGEMRKTDRDRMDDFDEIYDFCDAFDREYHIDTAKTFQE